MAIVFKVKPWYKKNEILDWEPVTWNGYSNIYGQDVWDDGTNIYYSHYDVHKKLDTSTLTWSDAQWTIDYNYRYFYGKNIWKDHYNNRIFLSNESIQLQYYKSNRQWYTKSWNGSDPYRGEQVWKHPSYGTIYYSNNSNYQVWLNPNTDTWSDEDWNGGYSDIQGDNVWIIGNTAYYSTYNYQYVLNGYTWSYKWWGGYSNFYGKYVWSDNDGNVYYSYGSIQKVLNISTSTWSDKTWTGLTNFYGDNIWKLGSDIYYSEYNSYTGINSQYKLVNNS